MRQLLALTGAMLVLPAIHVSTARASVLAYESFDYTPQAYATGNTTLSGGTGWNGAWAINSAETSIEAGSTTYAGLTTAGNQVAVQGGSNSLVRSLATGIDKASATSVWFSFTGATNRTGFNEIATAFGFQLSEGSTVTALVGKPSAPVSEPSSGGAYSTAGIDRYWSLNGASTNVAGTTYKNNSLKALVGAGNTDPRPTAYFLFVGKIDYDAGGNDTISVWVNPTIANGEAGLTNTGDGTPLNPYQQITVADASFDTITLFNNRVVAPNPNARTFFSNIRVGETFADVTTGVPTTAVPEPTAAGVLALAGAALARRRRGR